MSYDHYVRAYERTGFTGALNRYRNLDRDWEELADVKVRSSLHRCRE
jgi:hypothetical protein